MPNWCDNSAIIYGPKKKVLAIAKAFEEGNFCEHIHPIGDWDYNAAVNSWGTKWDVGGEDAYYDHEEVADDRVRLNLSFQSAWGPPTGVYEKLLEDEDMDCGAYYYEPGMSFCGAWSNGSDEYYEITGDSAWVEQEIPEAINKEFGISESMAQWEDEEEELSTWMREGAQGKATA